MWLSATKEVPMKDYKPKVINVTNNIRATIYPNGDFDISFLYDENRRWDFEFSKYNRIKQRVCTDGKTFKPITDLADNWKTFKFCLVSILSMKEQKKHLLGLKLLQDGGLINLLDTEWLRSK